MCKAKHLEPVDITIGKNARAMNKLMEVTKKQLAKASIIPRHYFDYIPKK